MGSMYSIYIGELAFSMTVCNYNYRPYIAGQKKGPRDQEQAKATYNII